MTHDQLGACIALEREGYVNVPMPGDAIPGPILMADPTGTKLVLVQGDGTVVDLLEVHRLAEDCVRNWHREKTLPSFVGDFKRLTPLAKALNGRRPPAPTPHYMGDAACEDCPPIGADGFRCPPCPRKKP